MTPEKDAILKQKYPKIFRKPEHASEPFDLWGFECNDGWFELIDTLCNRIQKHVDYRTSVAQDPDELEHIQVVAQQVKEKFGGLRFYVDGATEEHHNYIWFAENMSYRTCEVCGSPGKLYTQGWHTTLCEHHAKEHGYDEETEE